MLLLPGNHTTNMANEQDKVKKLYKWGKWETDTCTMCGVKYTQKKDFSVTMDHQDFVSKLSTTDFNLPRNLHILNGKNKVDAAGLKALRGMDGSLQWLATNSRVDRCAKVSLYASETSNPAIESLQKANKNNPAGAKG